MIRFVDVRGQGLQERFAFWDTVHGVFCTFNTRQAWTSPAEFEADFMSAGGRFSDRVVIRDLDDFTDFFPPWVSDGKEDDDECEEDYWLVDGAEDEYLSWFPAQERKMP